MENVKKLMELDGWLIEHRLISVSLGSSGFGGLGLVLRPLLEVPLLSVFGFMG